MNFFFLINPLPHYYANSVIGKLSWPPQSSLGILYGMIYGNSTPFWPPLGNPFFAKIAQKIIPFLLVFKF